jgi:hypothetical protein
MAIIAIISITTIAIMETMFWKIVKKKCNKIAHQVGVAVNQKNYDFNRIYH